jgi:hypothetical protein
LTTGSRIVAKVGLLEMVKREMETAMSNLVLFRLKDDESIYLADLEAGTVERRDPADIETGDPMMTDLVSAVGEARESDTPFTKGIDFALAARSRPSAASHYMFPSR